MCLPSSHGEQEEAVETARLPRSPCLSSCPDGERSNCYLGRDTVAQHGSPWPYPGWDLHSEKPAVPRPGRLVMASCCGRLREAEPCHHSLPGGRQQWCCGVGATRCWNGDSFGARGVSKARAGSPQKPVPGTGHEGGGQ